MGLRERFAGAGEDRIDAARDRLRLGALHAPIFDAGEHVPQPTERYGK
jgi:hypothetical protein